MTFSAETKTELCALPVSDKLSAAAECYGALLYGNTFSDRELRLVTANRAFARRLPRLFKKAFGISFDQNDGGEGRKFILSVTQPEKICRVFAAFGMDAAYTPMHHINFAVLEESDCRTAFLRGAFLAGGSVTEPEKRFHLELLTGHASVSRECSALLGELGFSPNETRRGGNSVLYFKRADVIADFLTMLGAPQAGMRVVNAKIEKSMSNTVNRKLNCDLANADKVVSAAQEQLAAIRRVDGAVGLANLPEGLQQAALLRIANPEASLADLAELSDPPVTKSCLNHRLKKLVEMAKTI